MDKYNFDGCYSNSKTSKKSEVEQPAAGLVSHEFIAELAGRGV